MTEPTFFAFREQYKAEKGRYPGEMVNPGDFPTSIFLGGKQIPVTWESLGTYPDEIGNTLEYFSPVIPSEFLTSDMTESLFDQIRVWDITNNVPVDLSQTKTDEMGNEIFEPARKGIIQLTKGKLSPDNVFREMKFHSLRQDLVDKGLDPSILGIPDVEDFLFDQLQYQQGDRFDPGYLEGLSRIMSEVQKDPSNADVILKKYAPSIPQTEEEQISQWGQQTFQGQQALQTFWGLPKIETFETEAEYQQNVVNQLKTQVEDIRASGIDLLNYNPLTSAYQQITGQYEASQQRLADLAGGALPSWSPQIREEQEQERQRLESEQIKKQQAKKKSALDLDFQRLVAQSRQPQRRAFL